MPLTLALLLRVAGPVETVLGGAGSVGEPDHREEIEEPRLSGAVCQVTVCLSGVVCQVPDRQSQTHHQHKYFSHFIRITDGEGSE